MGDAEKKASLFLANLRVVACKLQNNAQFIWGILQLYNKYGKTEHVKKVMVVYLSLLKKMNVIYCFNCSKPIGGLKD